MQTKDEISAEEIHWRIASDFARFMPHAFDEEIRKISEGRCDAKIKEAELKIWKDAGIRQKKYAMMLNCHLENAMDVANAFVFNSKAIFGPEMEITVKEEKGDAAKIICNNCPMINHSIDTGAETRIASELCSVFTVIPH